MPAPRNTSARRTRPSSHSGARARRGKRGRARTGNVKVWRRADGDVGYAIRFIDQYGNQQHVRCGLESEGWSQRLAEIALEDMLERVRDRTYVPPVELREGEDANPLFGDFAPAVIAEHVLTVRPSTQRAYLNLLNNHLLPAFSELRLTEITYDRIRVYRAEKVRLMDQLRRARERGVVIRRADRRPMTLAPKTINQSLWLLGLILEEAMRQSAIALEVNPARARNLRLKVPKRGVRDFLETDEVRLLLEAAARVDNPMRPDTVRRADEVRRLRDEEGLSIKETAKRLGLAENTVSVLYRQRPQQVVSQAQTMLALLAASGARNSEICALRPIDLDFAHRKIRVEHAKTSKGVREIDMTPWLCEQLQAWVRELGPDYDPRAPLFLNDRGSPYNKDVLNRLVKRIQAEAQQMCVERGLAPLPVQLTAHVFRRTYITHMFEASAAPSYVQEQVGHEDARTTIGIYSRVLRTRDRAKLGRAFDALLGCADAEEPPDDGEEGMALAA